jgi:uncharacterized protein
MNWPPLLHAVLAQYTLRQEGIHGLAHWARVLENGRRLAAQTGARLVVVELFAIFHDACRRDDGWDPNHGRRSAAFATALRGDLLSDGPSAAFSLTQIEFDLLAEACIWHSAGKISGDITLQTCWDADRLDLDRVGIIPSPRHLCTLAARDPDTLSWAIARSHTRTIPPAIAVEWPLNWSSYAMGKPHLP